MTPPSLVPELSLRDPAAGADLLSRVFGFARLGREGRLHLGAQQIELRADPAAAGHGAIDHLALAVDDLDAALAAAQARGGVLEPSVTPDGPLFIPEFWAAGTRYVFLGGPEGARIELCARPGILRHGLPGHDHIGIACTDLAAMRDFFLALGFAPIAAHLLVRPGGNVPVAFLGIGASVVELYAPPGLAASAASPAPHWSRLILLGAGGGSGPVTGPQGLVVDRRPA